jgi:hypothetical protein
VRKLCDEPSSCQLAQVPNKPLRRLRCTYMTCRAPAKRLPNMRSAARISARSSFSEIMPRKSCAPASSKCRFIVFNPALLPSVRRQKEDATMPASSLPPGPLKFWNSYGGNSTSFASPWTTPWVPWSSIIEPKRRICSGGIINANAGLVSILLFVRLC